MEVSSTATSTYTIKEAAALTGLPASTLRYYESIGVIAPISRGASSGHRVYDEDDLNRLVAVACLAATGMSIDDMRTYVGNNALGAAAAADQIALLEGQAARLVVEKKLIGLRQRYVAHKVDYWNAVAAGDGDRAELLSAEAHQLALEMRALTP